MGGRRRCCCGECWDWQDFFTVPHDDPEGPCRSDLEYWEVIYPEPPADTWYIEFNDPFCTLAEEGTQGATILCTEQVPNGPENDEDTLTSRFAKITVAVHDDQVGDRYSILMDWFWLDKEQLEANYLEFRYYRAASNSAVLSLYSYIDGVETLLEECTVTPTDPAGSGIYMEACVSRGSFYGTAVGATVIGQAVNTFDGTVTDLGFFFGLRHNNTHESLWSDWHMYQLIDDVKDCPFCGVCQCGFWCEGPIYPVPARLLLTYIGYDDGCEFCDDCTPLTGNTVVLKGADCDYDINQAIRDYVWRGTFDEESPCFAPYNGIARTVTLYCGPRPRVTDHCDPCDPFGSCEPPDGNPAWGWELGLTDVGPGLLYENVCPHVEYDHYGSTFSDYRLHSIVESSCNPFMLVFEVDFWYSAFQEGYPWPPNCGAPGTNCNQCGVSIGDPEQDMYRIHYRIVITEAPAE